MLKRSALNAWEYSFIYSEGMFFITHNHTASWTSERLVSGCGDKMCITCRRWMNTCCNKSGNMSDISHQIRTNLVSYLSKSFEINNSRIVAGTADYQLRLVFHCHLFDVIIVNITVFINAIAYYIEI